MQAARRPGRPIDPQLREHRTEEILDIATKLFARRGFAATDTQAIADALQVGKGTVYRYFKSKEELFLAAVDRGMHRLRDRIDAAALPRHDPLERVASAIHAYLAFFEDNPEIVELLMLERSQFKDRQRPTFFVHRDANIEFWRDLCRGLIAKGRLREMPVERIMDVTTDLLYGTMFTNYFTGRQRSFEDQARDILDVVFYGILSDGERSRRLSEK